MEEYKYIFNNARSDIFNNILTSISSKEEITIAPLDVTEKANNETDEIFEKYNNLPIVDEIILQYKEEDFPGIGIALIKENRLDDCLDLTSEIYNGDLIWEEGVYSSYFEPICKNAINNNDIGFLDSIKLVANQWFECKNFQYSLTFDEMLAQQIPLIMDTYIKLSINNIKDSEAIIIKSYHFFNSMIKILEDEFTHLYHSTCLLVSRSFLSSGYIEDSKEIMNRIYKRDRGKNNKSDSITFEGAFNYLFLKNLDLEELNEIAVKISNLNIEESEFLFSWYNIDEAVEANLLEHLEPLFMHANSGQSGIGPFFLKEEGDNLKKSSLLNFLFLKYCKIDAYSNGKEYLNQSIDLIKEIDDIYVRSRGYYLIMTVLADALNCKLANKEYYSTILNDAIYYASLVRDSSANFSCFCYKYNTERYKGIICDRCGRLVSRNGYKKLAFDYLFNNLSKSSSPLDLTSRSVNNILGNFKDISEKSTVICRFLSIISSEEYKFSESIDSIINVLGATPVGDKVDLTYLEDLKYNDQNSPEKILCKSLIEININAIHLIIPKILETYISMLRNYHNSKNIRDFNNCISHYFSLLNIIKERKVASASYLSLFKLLIDIDYIDKYINLIPKISNKSDIDQFSDSYVNRFDFTKSILFSANINKDIRDSFSLALSNDFNKLKDWQQERYIYLSNFNSSTNSLLNYLRYELETIDESNIEKANLLSEVLDNKTKEIEESI